MRELVINSNSEYQVIARRIEEIKDAPAQSLEAEELKIITRALVEYEKRSLRNASALSADNPNWISR